MEQATALASAIYRSGGDFEVAWGPTDVLVEKTVFVVNGTGLNVTGVGSNAGLDGGAAARLFTVVNASLPLSGATIHRGSAVVGGAIAAARSRVSLDRIIFSDNAALGGDGGALYDSESSTVLFSG